MSAIVFKKVAKNFEENPFFETDISIANHLIGDKINVSCKELISLSKTAPASEKFYFLNIELDLFAVKILCLK